MSLSFFPLPASLEHPLKFLQKPSKVLPQTLEGFAPNIRRFCPKPFNVFQKALGKT